MKIKIELCENKNRLTITSEQYLQASKVYSQQFQNKRNRIQLQEKVYVAAKAKQTGNNLSYCNNLFRSKGIK